MTKRTTRQVPTFSWSAPTRWTPKPSAMVLLLGGLIIFAIGDVLLINSNLGNSPWTTLAEGISEHSPLSIGWATVVVSFVVLLLWIPIKERPGIGTVANALVIGTTIVHTQDRIPEPTALAARVVFVVLGIAVIAAGGALYLSTHLGPGPRDGLMTGLGKRFDVPIARVRITVEIVAMAIGTLLGGTIGLGTVAFALSVGHILAFFLGQLARVLGNRVEPS